jgi:hypothetical protein
MMTVPLCGKKAAGRVVLIDDGDYELVSPYRWYIWEYRGRGPYARTNIDQRIAWMHKLITGWPRTDHANGDGLDNQRHNLRPASNQENLRNSRAHRGTSSRFKGVSYFKQTGRWEAVIRLNPGERLHLGRYISEEDAARAYNAAALEYFGEFARLNPLPDTSEPPAA